MNFDKIHNVYFIGIGGIGMSALARYFKTLGKSVSGYDRVSTPLTETLQTEGINIHFEDNISLVPKNIFSTKDNSLVVYTPAIPSTHGEYIYFQENGFEIMKRAEVLGFIFSNRKGVGVAGTHGKTTTSTMLAHLLKKSSIDCSAFLGGISNNYQSNLLLSDKSDWVVAEADEFDRSFLKLYPQLAVVTSTDADHLDIYGSHEEVKKSFNKFIRQINKNGALIYKKGIQLDINGLGDVKVFNYSVDEKADFFPFNIHLADGLFYFDVHTPDSILKGLKLGIPGKMNLENAMAAIAVAHILGVSYDELIKGLATFSGVKRRFEYQIRSKNFVYIDDYAHHPEELKACINSVRSIYPDKKITGIFQPHLFTRTRDFASEFAESLNLLDELILLDIYPAREEPIAGVTSEIIFSKVRIKDKILCNKDYLLDIMKTKTPEVLITMGAGDIDKFIDPIKKMFS